MTVRRTPEDVKMARAILALEHQDALAIVGEFVAAKRIAKPFLLMAGYSYYPDSGTGDCIGCYATKEEAESLIEKTDGQYSKYRIKGNSYDWYVIEDLSSWIGLDR